jgi:hypothetical protein
MAWTYSGDPSKSPLDQYRFEIGDTLEDDKVLMDEEINYILAKYAGDEDNIFYNLYDAATQQFARRVSRKLGPQSEFTSDRLNYFKDRTEYYRLRVQRAFGISQPKSTPAIFYKGMMDNNVLRS